jgi:leucyl aminopeptidase
MKVLFLVLALTVGTFSRPSEHEGKRLVQFTEEGPAQWLTPAEIDEAAALDINFIDITDHQDEALHKAPVKLFAIPTTVRFQPTVQAALAHLSVSRIQEFMVAFTTYHNRYYTAATGVESSTWLKNQIQNDIDSSNYPGVATVEFFEHSAWPQPSVIARLQGSDASAGLVILGAHQDSIASGGASGKAPGADDNASGSATILEAFRVLLASGFVPKATVEFQWYAAEEVGLRGSQAIADRYKADGKDVVGMVNFDMTGYQTSNTRIAIITDFTDAQLNQFIRIVVDAYNAYPWVDMRCGYACSDHASWYRSGFRSAGPHEGSTTSPYLHTTSDILSNLNYNRVLEFSKLAAGYAIELAEPSTSKL